MGKSLRRSLTVLVLLVSTTPWNPSALQALETRFDEASPNVPPAGELRIYNWEDYLSGLIAAGFTASTGVPVRQIFYESDVQRDRNFFSGLTSAFDVVVVDNVKLQAYVATGLLENLSTHTLENAGQVDQRWRDACGDYGIPFTWGMLGIAYRESQVRNPITHWLHLFHPPPELQGHIVMLDDPIELFMTALSVLDSDPNTDDRETLIKAYQLLRTQKNHVLGYGQPLLLNGAQMAATRAMAIYGAEFLELFGSNGASDWRFKYPEEGSSLWVDCMAVVASSPNKKQALGFLDYYLQAEQQAENSAYNLSPPVVNNALQYLDPDFRNNPIIFPPSEVVARSPVETLGSREGMRLRNRMSASLTLGKSLHGE